MIEIGDGKGDLPPTPLATEISVLDDVSVSGLSHHYNKDHKPDLWDIPEDALNFAQKMLKNFLLSMTENEAECT